MASLTKMIEINDYLMMEINDFHDRWINPEIGKER